MAQQAATANVARQLSNIDNAMRSINTQLSVQGERVDSIASEQSEMKREVVDLVQRVDAFIEADRKAKAVQLAETRILRVREELEREYGHYDGVRRSATGILQAFDSGIVTDEAVRSVSENLMITTPRYWLSPVLVAIAAWSRDERELAEKALAEAIRRDSDKSALLLTLVLRRFGRLDASAQWLDQYLMRQNPGGLSREFIVILECVANGGFGVAGKEVVSQQLDDWLSETFSGDDTAAEQAQRWRSEMELMSQPASGGYPTLAEYSPTWGSLSTSLGRARVNKKVQAHFDGVFAGELAVPATIQERMDDFLDSLVKSFDDEELPHRTEEARLQSIIDHHGDESQAQISFDTTRQALEAVVDFPTLLTNAAMHPDVADVSTGTQRLAIAMSKDWLVQGFDDMTIATRQAVPTTIELSVEGWHGSFSQPTEVETLVSEATGQIDRETAQELEKITFTKDTAGMGAAIGAAICVVLGAAAGPFFLVIALGLAIWAFIRYRGLEGRREGARRRGEDRKVIATERIRNACAELTDYRREWQDEDDVAEEVRQMLTAINPVEHQLRGTTEAREIQK